MPKTDLDFSVTPAEYALAMGMTIKGARAFFKDAAASEFLAKYFQKIGSRIYASRIWFTKLNKD